MLKSAFVVLMTLTFKKQFFSHCLSFNLVQVNHGHLRTGLTQGMSKRSAYALPGTRHIGHLSIKTQPIEDGAPIDPTENYIISYCTLLQTGKISRHENYAVTKRKPSVKV